MSEDDLDLSKPVTVMDIVMEEMTDLATGEPTWGLSFSIVNNEGVTISYLLPHESEQFVERANLRLRELRDKLSEDA